jgi:hypothetical protein
MLPIFRALLSLVASRFRSRLSLELEVMALRHQLGAYQRGGKRPRLRPADRLFSSWLARCWPRWREALVVVRPETVLSSQRKRCRDHWARPSQRTKCGRPGVPVEI